MSPHTPNGGRSSVSLLGALVADKYRIVRHIAQGGFGDIYEAEQSALNRRVALKIQRDGLDVEGDPNYIQRFLQEASAAAGLQHPNIVAVHDFGRHHDKLFLVMEFLEGKTVTQLLEEVGPLPVKRAIHIAKQICRALRAAHKKGIIHRDVKPANILLVERDEDPDFVKVLDFGLVRDVEATEDLTKEGNFIGTPRYMSPEHFGRAGADGRSDIYSLGVVLYRLLSNTVPFDGTMLQIMSGHLHHPPPLLAAQSDGSYIPVRLVQTVMTCLSKSRNDRFRTMGELLAELESIEAEPGLSDQSSIHSDITRLDSVQSYRLASGMGNTQRAKTLARAVAGVILLAGGLVVYQVMTPRPVLSLEAPAESVAEPPSINVAPTPTTVAIAVSITSEPTGAEVLADEQIIGKTPLQTTWEVPYAEATKPHKIEFRLPGHRARTLEVRPVNGRLVLEATLNRKPRQPDPRPADPVAGDDYKEDPY